MEILEQDKIKKKRGNPTWKKGGPAPNPGGRPKGIHELIDAACKKYNFDPIDELIKMASSDKLNAKDRTKLITEVLDRRYGKSLLTQDIKVSTPEPITFFCVDDEKDTNN